MCDAHSDTRASCDDAHSTHERDLYQQLHTLLHECSIEGHVAVQRHMQLINSLPKLMETERRVNGVGLFQYLPLMLRDFHVILLGHYPGRSYQSIQAPQPEQSTLRTQRSWSEEASRATDLITSLRPVFLAAHQKMAAEGPFGDVPEYQRAEYNCVLEQLHRAASSVEQDLSRYACYLQEQVTEHILMITTLALQQWAMLAANDGSPKYTIDLDEARRRLVMCTTFHENITKCFQAPPEGVPCQQYQNQQPPYQPGPNVIHQEIIPDAAPSSHPILPIQLNEHMLAALGCLVVITEAFMALLSLELKSRVNASKKAAEDVSEALRWIGDFFEIVYFFKPAFVGHDTAQLVAEWFEGRNLATSVLRTAKRYGHAQLFCSYRGCFNYAIQSVSLCIWICSTDASARYDALELLRCLPTLRGNLRDKHSLSHVYHSVIAATTPTAIEASILRDLRPEAHVGRRTEAVAVIYDGLFHGPYKPPGLDSALHLTILQALVAAWRRESCRRETDLNDSDMRIEWAIMRTASATPDTALTEKFVHKVLLPLAYLIHVIITQSFYAPPDLDPVLAVLRKFTRILRGLQPFKPVPTASKLHNVRISSAISWSKTICELREACSYTEQSIPRISGLYQPCGDLGVLVGRLAEQQGTDAQLNPSPVSPLKRCAYMRCFCFFHKPLHRMRVCMNNRGVVYCGKRCHDKDKKEGGHKCQ